MSYRINLGAWNSVFAVPCSVVDQGLKLAGSVQLKVLLWILRHAGEPTEAQDIASALGIERADVGDALAYWRESGILDESGGEFVPAAEKSGGQLPFQPAESPRQPEAAQRAAEPAAPQPEVPVRRVLSRPEKPDSDFVARRMAESKEIADLMQSAQQTLGRLISPGDSATLLMIHDDYGLPSNVIIMLMQYAASIGKPHTRYIEKIAIDWADSGVDTLEKAEERLHLLEENQKAWRTVETAVGLAHRPPSHREEKAAPVWVNDWKFSMPMIREAYDRTIDGTGKFQLSYMNRILERWHRDGISTPKQAADEEASRSAQKSAKKAAEAADSAKKYSFDLEEYEKTSVDDTKE